jgi:hypothetical protein
MKVIVKIHQMELYTSSYDGRDSTSKNDIVINAGNLVDAIELIRKIPNVETVNIHVNLTDYDRRITETDEDGDSE